MNRNADELKVGGLTRLSTCDWPGELAAVVFCQGCVWDCAYCHNPGLRPARGACSDTWPEVLEFLTSRRGLLDAVVFSGGEPLLQPALLRAVGEVRALGFRTGLHTTGMLPDRFAAILPHLDWVGFDVKAPRASYARITGLEQSGERAFSSLQMLLASRTACEIRTTVHPALHSVQEMLTLKEELLQLGVRSYTMQQFRTQGVRADRISPAEAALSLPEDFHSGFAAFQVR